MCMSLTLRLSKRSVSTLPRLLVYELRKHVWWMCMSLTLRLSKRSVKFGYRLVHIDKKDITRGVVSGYILSHFEKGCHVESSYPDTYGVILSV